MRLDLPSTSCFLTFCSCEIAQVLSILAETGYTEDKFYIHCDGALTGIMLPFMKDPHSTLSFKKPIGSISVSGHKFIGTPAPCGVIVMRRRAAMALSSDIEYLNRLVNIGQLLVAILTVKDSLCDYSLHMVNLLSSPLHLTMRLMQP